VRITTITCKQVLSFGFFLLSISMLRADVVALNQIIKPGESWTTPAGRGVTISNVASLGEADNPQKIFVSLPGVAQGQPVAIEADDVVALRNAPFSMYFRPGTVFSNPDTNNRSVILFGIFVSPAVGSIAQESSDAIPAGYYAAARGKAGEELKDALHTIIKGHKSYSYKKLWKLLSYTDEDPDDDSKVRLLYAGWSLPKTQRGNGNSDWTREHTWPKSHGKFGNKPPMGTDMHHLRPSDKTINNRRGSLEFDEGGDIYIDGDGVTKNRVDRDSWEPNDDVKGDVARMMFYMAVRYEGSAANEKDLELNEKVNNGSSPKMGKLSVLKKWHDQDPVDDFERRRNDRIFELQGNRNPFVDHPEFVEAIW